MINSTKLLISSFSACNVEKIREPGSNIQIYINLLSYHHANTFGENNVTDISCDLLAVYILHIISHALGACIKSLCVYWSTQMAWWSFTRAQLTTDSEKFVKLENTTVNLKCICACGYCVSTDTVRMVHVTWSDNAVNCGACTRICITYSIT